MKVLVVTVPASGHLNPMLPLIGELVAAGDEVVVACGEDPRGAAANAGATWRKAGGTEGEWFATLMASMRGAPGDGIRPERILHWFIPRIFGEVATADMVDDVVAVGREVQPDIVMFESNAFAGPLAADVLGVPAVHHAIGPLLTHAVSELADDAVSPIWRDLGRATPGHAGLYTGPTIELTPPTLEATALPAGRSLAMRAGPLPRPGTGATTVYVTLGTFFANDALIATVLSALADLDLRVLVTGVDPAAFEQVPANATLAPFVPQAEILPDASVIIHHGGAGTMFGALAHGVPQIVVPQGADNYVNADLLQGAGLGMTLRQPTVADVRNAVEAATRGPAHDKVRDEMAAMPSPADVAVTLRTLV